jgi:hypothetical protein
VRLGQGVGEICRIGNYHTRVYSKLHRSFSNFLTESTPQQLDAVASGDPRYRSFFFGFVVSILLFCWVLGMKTIQG